RGRCGRLDDMARQYAFSQVVAALKIRTARLSGDEACPEEPFKGTLRIAPLPPARRATMPLYIGCGKRAALFDLGLDAIDEWPVFSAKAGEAPINATSIAGTRHAPAQERLCLYRQKGCLVSPIFEGEAGLVRERTVEQRLRVGARA